MNGSILLAAFLALFVTAPLHSAASDVDATDSGGRGFAGLGEAVDGFANVTPGRSFEFPRDLGPHPDYRIEWWYVTANLQDAAGERYGMQWTLFRQALAPGPQREGWASQQFWMAHAALTTRDAHYHAERFARGGVGQAGVDAQPFRAWIDHWSMSGVEGADRPIPSTFQLTASEDRGDDSFAYNLVLSTEKPIVPQGQNGYSVKSEDGQASYYYSQPFFEVSGAITIDGEEKTVTGNAWLDREWSTQFLSPDQQGWDWFAFHLPGGAKMMLFRLRHTDGDHFFSGTFISPDGTPEPLSPDEIRLTPGPLVDVAPNRRAPVEWTVEVPHHGVRLETTPLNPKSWMATSFQYWEGPISFTGTHEGFGYLEMTGY